MMNVKRLFALLALLGSLVASAYFLRSNFAFVETPRSSDRPDHVPALTEIHVPPDELAELVEALARTERWWNSLAFAHVEYQVTVEKSEQEYQRAIKDRKASFPDSEIDEDAFPDLARVWDIKRSLTFDETRLIWSGRSNAFGLQTELWGGESLTGYRDYGTAQEPNYYLKADVGDLHSATSWLPRVGTSTTWFADLTPFGYSTWQEVSPVLAGGIRFASRDCVVLRDARNHWIVGREDRRVYGRYSRREWEEFDQHREAAPGVFWPMASVRKRLGDEGLKWTDRATVTVLKVDERPENSVFEMEMKAGIKVCDLRTDYPVVYTFDPNRTPDELAEIYSAAKEEADRRLAAEARSRQLIGKDAPDLGEGQWLNSEPLSLRELRGKRPVLLGFGYVGCAPCGNMLAMFSKRQQSSTDQLILVFAASDSIDAVQEKLDLYGLRCPTFVPGDDTGFGEVFERYRVNGFPTLVKIDVVGKIESHQVGTL